MTPQERLELLLRGGKVLYGESGWQTQLAAGLGIGLRRIQRWVAGSGGYPEPGVIDRLDELLRAHAREIKAMRGEIKARRGFAEAMIEDIEATRWVEGDPE